MRLYLYKGGGSVEGGVLASLRGDKVYYCYASYSSKLNNIILPKDKVSNSFVPLTRIKVK